MSNETQPQGMVFGYSRVSTTDQDQALQEDALTKAGVDQIFTDTASGAKTSRPALDELLSKLRPGDIVVVWRLDRLGRSLRHLIDVFSDLESRGVAIRSLTESLDTSTPGGGLIFHVFGALAEFERDLIRERTNAGLVAARARGRTGGRPSVWTAEKLQTAQDLLAQGTDIATVSRILGVSRASIYRNTEIPRNSQ